MPSRKYTMKRRGGAVPSPAPLSKVNTYTSWPGGIDPTVRLYDQATMLGGRRSRRATRRGRKSRRFSRRHWTCLGDFDFCSFYEEKSFNIFKQYEYLIPSNRIYICIFIVWNITIWKFRDYHSFDFLYNWFTSVYANKGLVSSITTSWRQINMR